MEDLGYVERCIQQLNTKGITVITYNKVNAEPTNIHVLEALTICKEENVILLSVLVVVVVLMQQKQLRCYIQMVEKWKIMFKRI